MAEASVTQETKLLPCPFCGCDAPELEEHSEDVWQVECDCGAAGTKWYGPNSQARAVESWNLPPRSQAVTK